MDSISVHVSPCIIVLTESSINWRELDDCVTGIFDSHSVLSILLCEVPLDSPELTVTDCGTQLLDCGTQDCGLICHNEEPNGSSTTLFGVCDGKHVSLSLSVSVSLSLSLSVSVSVSVSQSRMVRPRPCLECVTVSRRRD